MYTGLLHLHNLLRWVILILLVVALIRHLAGVSGRKPLTSGDKKVGLFLLISAHIQFLIGLYQWIAGPWGWKNIQNVGMSGIMQNSGFRFWAVEHLLGMLVAIILITVGRGVYKKNLADQTKHTRAFWFYFIALILILVSVPWPFREAVARPLFPGMS